MKNFRITIKDYFGEKSFIVAANSKYQAMQEIKTIGEAVISCEPTQDQTSFVAVGASSIRLSKKFAAYLANLP